MTNNTLKIANLRPEYQNRPFPGSGLPSIQNAVEEAQLYIDRAWKDDDTFVAWPEHEEWAPNYGALSLYTGAAGVAWFQLVKKNSEFTDSRDDERLERALSFIARHWEETYEQDKGHFSIPAVASSYPGGPSGVAAVVSEAARQNKAWEPLARDIADYVIDSYQPGKGWSGLTPLWGDAGVANALLSIGKTLEEPKYVDVAVQAAEELLRKEVRDEDGSHWPFFRLAPQFAQYLSYQGNPDVTDGYTEGNDGIALVLSNFARVTQRDDFRQAALRSISTIQGKAIVVGDSAVARNFNKSGNIRLGLCTGSSGYVRIFTAAAAALNEKSEEFIEWARRFGRGIIRSGVPGRLAQDNYWLLSQCCGAAAVLEAFVGLWLETGEELWFEAASAQADDLLIRSYSDALGRRWYTEAYAFNDIGRLKAEVGYQVGAAGVVLSLIHFHQIKRSHDDGVRFSTLRLPDEPYATGDGVFRFRNS